MTFNSSKINCALVSGDRSAATVRPRWPDRRSVHLDLLIVLSQRVTEAESITNCATASEGLIGVYDGRQLLFFWW